VNKKYCDVCGVEIISDPYFDNVTMSTTEEENADKFDVCRKCLRTKTTDEIAKHLLTSANKRAARVSLAISMPIDFRDT
jgi:hypothetical protein